MFSGVNENFPTATIEGALAIAGDLVNLDAIWGVATKSGADVLPAGPDVRRATQTVLKKWWRSFGYNYVLANIRAKHEEVLVCDFCFDFGGSYSVIAFLRSCWRKKRWLMICPLKLFSGPRAEEAVDASDGFDDAGVVRDGASNDVDEGDVRCWAMWDTPFMNVLLILSILLVVPRLRDWLSLRRFRHHILMLKRPRLIW
jgi:hypothetical protein